MSNPECDSEPGFSTLFIVGAGGHGREAAWLAAVLWGDRVSIVHVVDDSRYLVGTLNGNPVEHMEALITAPDARYIVAIGNGIARRRLVQKCEQLGLRAATLVHPRAEIAESASLAEGVLIYAGCVVTTNVDIGRHSHLNIGCRVSHDVRLGDYVSLSPGVVISGYVDVRSGAFLGAGSTVINGAPDQPLVIGENAVVAAGACVTRAVDAGAVVAGVPAVRNR